MAGNDQYTKILLHCDGTNGSTTFTDECAGTLPHTFTVSGTAKVDTGTKEFGSGSLSCSGVTSWISTPNSTDFTAGSGDFTVDFWFNNSGGGGTTLAAYGQGDSTGGANLSYYGLKLAASDKFECGTTTDGVTQINVVSSSTFSASGWHHCAFVRTGNTLKMFLDGTQEGANVAISGSIFNSSNNFRVGALGELTTNTWNGFIDEFRLSVGIARWTVNFTPPAAPYDTGLYNYWPQNAPILAQ